MHLEKLKVKEKKEIKDMIKIVLNTNNNNIINNKEDKTDISKDKNTQIMKIKKIK